MDLEILFPGIKYTLQLDITLGLFLYGFTLLLYPLSETIKFKLDLLDLICQSSFFDPSLQSPVFLVLVKIFVLKYPLLDLLNLFPQFRLLLLNLIHRTLHDLCVVKKLSSLVD